MFPLWKERDEKTRNKPSWEIWILCVTNVSFPKVSEQKQQKFQTQVEKYGKYVRGKVNVVVWGKLSVLHFTTNEPADTWEKELRWNSDPIDLVSSLMHKPDKSGVHFYESISVFFDHFLWSSLSCRNASLWCWSFLNPEDFEMHFQLNLIHTLLIAMDRHTCFIGPSCIILSEWKPMAATIRF